MSVNYQGLEFKKKIINLGTTENYEKEFKF